jgi:DNA-binding response OmpR family regulator
MNREQPMETVEIIITGLRAETAELRSLDAGADAYIAKSESREILLPGFRALNSPEDEFRSASILIIDDSPTYLAALCQEMRSQGYQVKSAPSGADGLKELLTQRFDCVLVDLVMPYLSGIEVCRRITEMRSHQDHVPAVILLTGAPNQADMNRGLEAGADDFVSKSSDLAILRARIQALLRRRFFQEETRRIVEELKTKELETLRALAGREAAEIRAAMAERLVRVNKDLQ